MIYSRSGEVNHLVFAYPAGKQGYSRVYAPGPDINKAVREFETVKWGSQDELTLIFVIYLKLVAKWIKWKLYAGITNQSNGIQKSFFLELMKWENGVCVKESEKSVFQYKNLLIKKFCSTGLLYFKLKQTSKCSKKISNGMKFALNSHC